MACREHEDDTRVTVDREEYDAFKGLAELNERLTANNAKIADRNRDLLATCDAQARRLSDLDLVVRMHERVCGLQQSFIDLVREDRPGVMSFAALSEFWRRWCISSSSQPKDEVAKFEPDLFRTWRNFVNNAGRWSVAGTREEVASKEAAATPRTLHEDKEAHYKNQIVELSRWITHLEEELTAYKKVGR